MCARRQLSTTALFARHPVFTLRQAVAVLSPEGDRSRIRDRLRYHVQQGGLKLLERELYAVVPPDADGRSFSVDPFLAGAAVRPDGIFAHHAALEFLGAAHSMWRRVTLFTDSRRRPLDVGGVAVRFLAHPKCLRDADEGRLGTRTVERAGEVLRVTGPERTLVEGFRDLAEVGGPEELVVSAGGFPSLDLELLARVLDRYAVRSLWSAVGWFLERHRRAFHVDETVLKKFERHRPRSRQYMVRDSRGGTLSPRWNLILPAELLRREGTDDR
jgi:predicted transcriptional regulator of viral defense system